MPHSASHRAGVTNPFQGGNARRRRTDREGNAPSLSGITVGDAFTNYDAPRRVRLRHDTPHFNGFTAAAFGRDLLSDDEDLEARSPARLRQLGQHGVLGRLLFKRRLLPRRGRRHHQLEQRQLGPGPRPEHRARQHWPTWRTYDYSDNVASYDDGQAIFGGGRFKF